MAYVNLDPVPGVFYTGVSALENLRGILTNRISIYHPTVGFAPSELQPDEHGRLAVVIYIDMEPTTVNPKRFAMQMVRGILRDMILHYNPVVSYAPRQMQPSYLEGVLTS